MTKQEIAAKLREALALMNDSGKHWVQGDFIEVVDEYVTPDGTYKEEYGYCSIGAIRTVLNGSVEDSSPESDAVALALADVLPETPPFMQFSSESDEGYARRVALDKIVNWNDDMERRWEEVVEKFNEAAARAEAEA